MLGQRLADDLGQRHGAPGPRRLRRHPDPLVRRDLPLDPDRPAEEVDVGQPQRQQLGSTPRLEVFRETKADQFSVFLRLYNYVAFQGGRYPRSLSVVTGTGLAATGVTGF